MVRNGVVFATDHLGVEAFHSCGAEGRLLSDHFVEDTAKWPDIWSVVVGHVFPNFGAGVVRSTSLSTEHTSLGYFGDIEVTEFDNSLFSQEQVGALDVSVADLEVVECLEASNDLNEVVPDHFFTEVFFGLLFVVY